MGSSCGLSSGAAEAVAATRDLIHRARPEECHPKEPFDRRNHAGNCTVERYQALSLQIYTIPRQDLVVGGRDAMLRDSDPINWENLLRLIREVTGN